MERHSTVLLVCLAAIICSCTKNAPPAQQSPPTVNATAVRPQSPSDVTVQIRKLGGPDKKQVLNSLKVATPIDDEFTVTEQVGSTQLELRGKVLDLKDGKYRVVYDYAETSATGRQRLKSLIEMPLNSEKEIGGVLGRGDGGDDSGAMETVVLSLSRP
jgi:hypothetical protein